MVWQDKNGLVWVMYTNLDGSLATAYPDEEDEL